MLVLNSETSAMRLTTRLAIVITALLLIFLSGTIFFQRSVIKNADRLRDEWIEASKDNLLQVLNNEAQLQQAFLKIQTSALQSHLQESPSLLLLQLQRSKLNSIDRVDLYDCQQHRWIISNQNADTLQVPREALNSKESFARFFCLQKNELAEIASQAIYDPILGTKRYILFCSNDYSNAFCSNIANQIDKSFCKISKTSTKDNFNRQTGELLLSLPLNDIHNEAVAYLQLNRHFPLYATFAHYQILNNYFFIFFSLGLLLLLFGFVLWYVNRPLLALLKAIYHRNETPLAKLKSRRDEFAQLATLITLFFQQRRRLLTEVESRKASEQQLKEAIAHVENSTIEKIKAEKADEAKRVFISNISHELRTPMNAVVAISEMLLAEQSKEEQEKLVKVLGYSAKQLTTLVTDILDFSKIESNSLELIPQSFSLDKLCDELVQMFTFTAHAKNIRIRLEGDERVRQHLIGDPHRLNQIFINLLGNAVKFTDHGEIVLSYRLVQHTTDQKVQLLFEVKDTGIGISSEDLPHVFERFYQANAAPDKKNPGTGLGLSLSAKLVELMGGKLAVESQLGKGTQFFFTLQFQLDKQGPVMSNPEAAFPQGKLTGLNVLVAEDHEINAFVLKQFFAKWEVKASFVGNGQLALDALREQNFDLVLMDLQMPVLDGYQTVQAIRSWPEKRFQTLPVVAVTADASKETRDLLLKNGFDLFISKPFDPAALYHTLQTVRQHRFIIRPDVGD